MKHTHRLVYCMVVLLGFPFFAAAHLSHHCRRKTCPICRALEKSHALLLFFTRLFMKKRIALTAAPSCHESRALSYFVRPFTLIALRVKLSD